MKAGYVSTFKIEMILAVITTVTVISILSDFTITTSVPLLTTLILSSLVLFLSFILRKNFTLNIIRRFGILGGLLISPTLLFLTSLPAAVICFVTKIRGGDNGAQELALITFISAVVFITSMAVFTYPALTIISSGAETHKKRIGTTKALVLILVSVISTSLPVFGLRYLLTFRTRSYILLLPLLSGLMIFVAFVLYRELRLLIKGQITADSAREIVPEAAEVTPASGLFMNFLLFQNHYIHIISGKLDYLLDYATYDYAVCIVRTASRTYDPALRGALKAVSATERFPETLRHEALVTVENIEKYFSDPLKNNDMIVQSGLTEKIAMARSVFFGQHDPVISEVLKLLRDSDPDLRKIGITAVARYEMTDLLEEVIQALSAPETEKEAFHALKHFSPWICNQVVEYYLNHPCGERVNVMIIRLLGAYPDPDSISSLSIYIGRGSIGVRTEAIRQLRRCGFVPAESEKERLTDTCLEVITNLTKIISFQSAAGKYKYLLLEKALKWDREKNINLLFTILPFLIGSGATELLLNQVKQTSGLNSRWAAEIIKAAVDDRLRGPLLALLDNHSDRERLHELSLYFPVKEILRDSLASLILAPDQDITSIWTKACALRKVSDRKLEVDKDLLMSFLFNKRTILLEEGARAIATINRTWFDEAADRIPEQVKAKISTIIEGSRPDVTFVFEKTRFLELCFNGIPEERLLYLASKLKFSETQDTRLMPDQMTWIVPAESDRSGLYTLSVNGLIDFIFHYSEYTDIFVDYIDHTDRSSVLQIIN